jgi:hypothetical protein
MLGVDQALESGLVADICQTTAAGSGEKGVLYHWSTIAMAASSVKTSGRSPKSVYKNSAGKKSERFPAVNATRP